MKCVVSLSGGRDSATCLGLACEKYGSENVYTMGFEYGSKHPQELISARKIANYYDVPFQVVTIDPSIFQGSSCTLLKTGGQIELDKTYKEILSEKEGKVSTYVPARNTLFSAYVLARAESLSQEFNDDVTIILGQHADDSGFKINDKGEEVLDATHASYPDCSVEFVNAFANVARISSVDRVHYWAPFVAYHKWELIKTGMYLKKPVPYEMCMSCYDPIKDPRTGEWKECGRCSTCLDVKEAETKAKASIEEDKKNGVVSYELYEQLVRE